MSLLSRLFGVKVVNAKDYDKIQVELADARNDLSRSLTWKHLQAIHGDLDYTFTKYRAQTQLHVRGDSVIRDELIPAINTFTESLHHYISATAEGEEEAIRGGLKTVVIDSRNAIEHLLEKYLGFQQPALAEIDVVARIIKRSTASKIDEGKVVPIFDAVPRSSSSSKPTRSKNKVN